MLMPSEAMTLLRTRCHADPTKAGKFERRPAQIEPEHAAKEIQLEPFDPANGQADITAQRRKHSGAGRNEGAAATAALGALRPMPLRSWGSSRSVPTVTLHEIGSALAA